jgi:hypothetical protein
MKTRFLTLMAVFAIGAGTVVAQTSGTSGDSAGARGTTPGSTTDSGDVTRGGAGTPGGSGGTGNRVLSPEDTDSTRDYPESHRRRRGSGSPSNDPGSAGSLSSPGGSSTQEH